MNQQLDNYDCDGFDEAIDTSGKIKKSYSSVFDTISQLGPTVLSERVQLAEVLQTMRGESFTCAGNSAQTPLPLDLIPRVIPAQEWDFLEAGIKQRVKALESFLTDVYSTCEILRDAVIPSWVVLGSAGYQRSAFGINPKTYIHVAGLDLVKDKSGSWKVLEDNIRVPSGVSYMVEHREILARVLPELFQSEMIRPVNHYAKLLQASLMASAPNEIKDSPYVVLLTPGIYNSAWFEHAFLARQMGIELVETGDLLVEENKVFVRTTAGPKRVDVIYRRIDEEFLDPLVLRPDSLLGVPGLVNAVRSKTVAIANAFGTGIGDDKAVYAYMPKIINYYLGEKPLLGNVPTLLMGDPEQKQHALSNVEKYVFKPVNGSGGKGIVLGNLATNNEVEELLGKINSCPTSWIAQEFIEISTHPTLVGENLEPRHIDLRPFAVNGEKIEILPGGLTRVALDSNGLVVNSSQGGGSKDTWILRSQEQFHTKQINNIKIDPFEGCPSPVSALKESVAFSTCSNQFNRTQLNIC